MLLLKRQPGGCLFHAEANEPAGRLTDRLSSNPDKLFMGNIIPAIQNIEKTVKFYFNRSLYMRNAIELFSTEDLARIIEMAWEDRTPFEAIETNFGTNEGTVIQIMRSQLNPSAFRSWRKRVSRRKTKHLHLRAKGVSRGYCATQYKHR